MYLINRTKPTNEKIVTYNSTIAYRIQLLLRNLTRANDNEQRKILPRRNLMIKLCKIKLKWNKISIAN